MQNARRRTRFLQIIFRNGFYRIRYYYGKYTIIFCFDKKNDKEKANIRIFSTTKTLID